MCFHLHQLKKRVQIFESIFQTGDIIIFVHRGVVFVVHFQIKNTSAERKVQSETLF